MRNKKNPLVVVLSLKNFIIWFSTSYMLAIFSVCLPEKKLQKPRHQIKIYRNDYFYMMKQKEDYALVPA